jgi:Family of unknown function (DUF6527)
MRNVELQGPTKFGERPNDDIYYVWFDCDCGRRMAVLASPSGSFQIGHSGVWKLTINGDRLSLSPSILFKPEGGGHPKECHMMLTDEPFTRAT